MERASKTPFIDRLTPVDIETRQSLEAYLRRIGKGIQALRSFNNIVGKFNIPEEDLNELIQQVQEGSQGEIDVFDGVLFQASEQEAISRHGTKFDSKHEIKGMLVRVNKFKVGTVVAFIDPGKSLESFNQLSTDRIKLLARSISGVDSNLGIAFAQESPEGARVREYFRVD